MKRFVLFLTLCAGVIGALATSQTSRAARAAYGTGRSGQPVTVATSGQVTRPNLYPGGNW